MAQNADDNESITINSGNFSNTSAPFSVDDRCVEFFRIVFKWLSNFLKACKSSSKFKHFLIEIRFIVWATWNSSLSPALSSFSHSFSTKVSNFAMEKWPQQSNTKTRCPNTGGWDAEIWAVREWQRWLFPEDVDPIISTTCPDRIPPPKSSSSLSLA